MTIINVIVIRDLSDLIRQCIISFLKYFSFHEKRLRATNYYANITKEGKIFSFI